MPARFKSSCSLAFDRGISTPVGSLTSFPRQGSSPVVAETVPELKAGRGSGSHAVAFKRRWERSDRGISSRKRGGGRVESDGPLGGAPQKRAKDGETLAGIRAGFQAEIHGIGWL